MTSQILSQSNYDALSAAIAAVKLPALTIEQASALAKNLGVDELVKLTRGAKRGEATAHRDLERWIQAIRAQSVYARLGLEASPTQCMALLNAQGDDRVRQMFTDANRGDRNALQILTDWLKNPSSNAPDPATAASGTLPSQRPMQVVRSDGAPTRAPVHATTLSPPTAGEQGATRTVPVERAATTSAPPQATASSTRAANQAATSRPVGESPTRGPEPPRRPPESTPARDTVAEKPFYNQKVAYGKDVAIEFQGCPTKDKNSETINISMGKAKNGRTTNGIDWQNKMVFMLESFEVDRIFGVLMGLTPTARFPGHGPKKNKWLEVSEVSERTDPKNGAQWGGTIRFVMGEGDDIRRCSIGPTDVGDIIDVFLRVIEKKSRVPGSAAALMPSKIRRISELHALYEAAKKLREQGNRAAA